MNRIDFYWLLNYSKLPERNCCYAGSVIKETSIVKCESRIEMVLEDSGQIWWLVQDIDHNLTFCDAS